MPTGRSRHHHRSNFEADLDNLRNGNPGSVVYPDNSHERRRGRSLPRSSHHGGRFWNPDWYPTLPPNRLSRLIRRHANHIDSARTRSVSRQAAVAIDDMLAQSASVSESGIVNELRRMQDHWVRLCTFYTVLSLYSNSQYGPFDGTNMPETWGPHRLVTRHGLSTLGAVTHVLNERYLEQLVFT